MPTMTTLEQLWQSVLTRSAQPRLVVYDDTAGPSAGERIELSGHVLSLWAAKAANLLVDELDVDSDTRVGCDLPAHWRAVYWALATWTVGADLVLPPSDGAQLGDCDVVVTTQPGAVPPGTPGVLVSLPALARRTEQHLSRADLVDEAATLATYPDVFAGARANPALPDLGEALPRGARVHTTTLAPDELLRTCVSTWAVDGVVVLSRGPVAADTLQRRLSSEGITIVRG